MKVVLLQVTGYGFLVLGTLGLFLPVLQGILFILIGLVILARHAGWAQRVLERFRAHHPRAAELIDRAEAKSLAWWQRVVAFSRRSMARVAELTQCGRR